jgi:hypothetical protein
MSENKKLIRQMMGEELKLEIKDKIAESVMSINL